LTCLAWGAPLTPDEVFYFSLDAPGFVRIEILRSFVPGLPLLPALISNPIYFEEG
jgi:hypothetical protein